MNHPTNEVDDLYELANEAAACHDFEQAVIFLRKALEIAPLRKDVRRALAAALAQNKFPSSTDAPARSFAPAPPPRPAEKAAVAAAPPALAHDTSGAKSLWIRPQANIKSGSAPGGSGRNLSTATHGSLSLALQESEAELDIDDFEEDSSSELLEPHDPALENAPLAAPRKSNRKRVAGGKDFEDFIAELIESLGRLFSSTNRPRIFHGMAYAAAIIFVCTACYTTSREFGTDLADKAAAAYAGEEDKKSSSHRLLLGGTGVGHVVPNGSDRLTAQQEADTVNKARSLLSKGQYDAAISLLKPGFQSGIRTPGRQETRSILAQAYDAHGTTQLTRGEIENAVETYREAVKLLPNDYSYRLHLANALYHLGNSRNRETLKTAEEAIQIASELIKLDPSNVNAHQVQARSQQLAGKKKDAIRSWQEVVKLVPQNSRAAEEAQTQLKKLSKV